MSLLKALSQKEIKNFNSFKGMNKFITSAEFSKFRIFRMVSFCEITILVFFVRIVFIFVVRPAR